MAKDSASASASKGNEANRDAKEVAVTVKQEGAMKSAATKSGASVKNKLGAGVLAKASVEGELAAGVEEDNAVKLGASVKSSKLEEAASIVEEQEVSVRKGIESKVGAG